MALVQYSDSDSDSTSGSESESHRPTKKPRTTTPKTRNPPPDSSLPPLPPAFHDLYASSTRVSVSDDPSLHGGRKRVIPHVEGNWPTHIYLEWHPSKQELSILSDITAKLEDVLGEDVKLNTLLRSDLGAQLPLHISLSRPVVLRTEQRSLFLEKFREGVEEAGVTVIDTSLENLDCVSNYQKTRWFFVLRIQKPVSESLIRLLRISNRSLAFFGQPPLYETTTSVPESSGEQLPGGRAGNGDSNNNSHCFHISLAWSLNEPSSADRERISKIDLTQLEGLDVRFDCVKAKIGNQISSIPLAT